MAWPARFGLLRLLALLVLVAGSAGSIALAEGGHTVMTREHSERVDRLAAGRATAIEAAMARYEDALYAERSLFLASTHVSRKDFEIFARNLALDQRYPGMRGIGWVSPVAGDQLDTFVTGARQDGPADFAVGPPGRRAAYYVVLYNEPASRLAATWGLDARVNPTVRPFLEAARDSGRATLSGKADFGAGLKPGEQQPVTFVLYLPVYRDGAPTGSVAQRRAAFLGWASCRFRATDFLTGTLRGPRQQLGVELFDQSADDANRIASFPDGFRAGGPDLRTSQVEVGGRRWLLRTSPLPGAPILNSTQLPAWVPLAAGLLLTVLLAGLVWLLARRARTVRLLDRQRAGLAVASAFKSDLIGMLSHDLRQPLASVVGHVELLREDWDQIEEADKRRFLDRVADAAGRVDRLVEDLLTMTKGDAGKLEPDLRPVQVAAAVAEALAHVTPSEPIEVSVDPSVWVQADPGHLQQILINLLSNAVKYGSPPITVAAALTGGHHEGATDQAVELEVRDHGPGVPAEFVPKLFGRFARAERDDGIKGTGLGLYIVRQLVAAGHGDLRYQAQPPSGAAFVVRLPAAEPPPGSHPTPGERPRFRSLAPAPRR